MNRVNDFLRRRGWLGLLAALAIALAYPGFAQESSATSGQKIELIRRYMEEGQGLYLAKDYEGAAKRFEEGYEAYPYSAFLFNLGVCYQKLDDIELALQKFNQYLRVDPNAPDAAKVEERVALLTKVVDARRLVAAALAAEEARKAAAEAAIGAEGDADGGVAAVDGDAGPVDPDAAVAPPPAPPIPVVVPEIPDDDSDAMRSLVVIETEPAGAPVRLYTQAVKDPPPFVIGQENPGWKRILAASSPASMALPVGRYHVVIDKFRDYNTSDTVIDISPGHVHHFKANLSQGAFMSFLRVSANVRGAYVYLDEDKKDGREWGTTPYGELVTAGKHDVIIESPGFQPLKTQIDLKHGEQMELDVELVRVNYGILRVAADAPEVKVEIDGKPVGVWKHGEPPLQVKVPSGPHQLAIEADGRKTFEGEVTVPHGLVLPVKAEMIETYPRGTAWTESILAALFIGGGVYLTIESNNLYDEANADAQLGYLDAEDDRLNKGKYFEWGAAASFTVGGVLAGLATYHFLKDPYPESSTKYGNTLEFHDPKSLRPGASLERSPITDVQVGFGASDEGGAISVQGRF